MRVVLYGATSAMAQAAARDLASEKATFVLIARNAERLEALAADLRVRGAARVETLVADLGRTEDPQAAVDLWEQADARCEGATHVLVAHGVLPDQEACQRDPARAMDAMTLNLLSPIALLTPVIETFAARRAGAIAVITSVAGDRGRQSNYTYGAAKGGLSIWLQGVRHRLAPLGVRVIDIRPGFVSSPMTAHLPQGPLFASADVAGRRIAAVLRRGDGVVYVPWFWRLILWVIRNVPAFVFHRTKL